MPVFTTPLLYHHFKDYYKCLSVLPTCMCTTSIQRPWKPAEGVGFSGTGAIQSVGSSALPWDPGFTPQRNEAGSRAVVLGLPDTETL